MNSEKVYEVDIDGVMYLLRFTSIPIYYIKRKRKSKRGFERTIIFDDPEDFMDFEICIDANDCGSGYRLIWEQDKRDMPEGHNVFALEADLT